MFVSVKDFALLTPKSASSCASCDDPRQDHAGLGQAGIELKRQPPDALDTTMKLEGPPITDRACRAGLVRGATTIESFVALLNKIVVGVDIGKVDLEYCVGMAFRRQNNGELFLKSPVTAAELVGWFGRPSGGDTLDPNVVLRVLASLDAVSVTFRVKGGAALNVNEQVGRTSAASRAAAAERATASIECAGGAGVDARDASQLCAYANVCCKEDNYCAFAADAAARAQTLIEVGKKASTSTASTASITSTASTTTSSSTASFPSGSLAVKRRHQIVDKAAEAPKATALKLRAALGLGPIAPRDLYRSIIVFVGNPTFNNVRGHRPTPTKALLRALGQVRLSLSLFVSRFSSLICDQIGFLL